MELFVKYKHQSYLHAEWVNQDVLKADRFGKRKLEKFFKQFRSLDDVPDDEDTILDFCEVDRILNEAIVLDHQQNDVRVYLVKWSKLPYDECTWEREDDIKDDQHIHDFRARNELPEHYEDKKRPTAAQWPGKLEEPHIYKNDNQLRPYQQEGHNWLVFNWYNGRNCILADEMGLGKTVQAMSITEHMFRVAGLRGPYLVVAPLSTLPHWEREYNGWTDMNAVVYHGNATARDVIRQNEFYYHDVDGKIIPGLFKFNVLITTYDLVMQDAHMLKKINWRALVIDEAHRLKNRTCKLIDALLLFKAEYRLLLTGTPLQNNTEELWSLLNFLEPDSFGSLDAFVQQFGSVERADQVEKLQQLLRPHMLRRLKEDVEKSIAPKEETIIEVELTIIQKKYYRAILEHNLDFLRKGAKGANAPNLINIMMELRKCCNHPYLIKGVEGQVAQGLSGDDAVYDALIQASGKLVLVDKLLPRLQQDGHKVLIFSQMTRVLDILEDYLTYRKYKYERIDGRVRGNDRQAAIDRFSKPGSDRDVFLLCTRAGGLGINLVAADTVIIFDSDWNPQNDLQAQARCHRIGQTQSVKIYRLITSNTYERSMFERASLKLGLDQAVLGSKQLQESDDVPQMDKAAIDNLLKRGAYDLLKDDNDEASKKFFEEDIDQILERRAKTVVSKVNETAGEPTSTFSKASFVSKEKGNDVDLNDPHFWDKLLPKKRAVEPDYVPDERASRSGALAQAEESDGDGLSDLEVSDVEHESEISQAAQARLHAALMRFGFGRWKAILTHSKMRGWTVPDVRHWCIQHLAAAQRNAKENSKIFLDYVLDWLADVSGSADRREAREFENLSGSEDDIRSMMQATEGSTILDPDTSQWLLERNISLMALSSWVQSNVDPRKLPIPNVTGGHSIPNWWGEEQDRSLLLGVFKHGYGQFDKIRADPDLCFQGFVQPANGPLEDEMLRWPRSHVLARRLKLLLKRLGLLMKSRAKDVVRKPLRKNFEVAMRDAEKERRMSEKRSRGITVDKSWTKREMYDLLKAVCCYGVPSKEDGGWRFLQEAASLQRKPLGDIESFYHFLSGNIHKTLSLSAPKDAMRSAEITVKVPVAEVVTDSWGPRFIRRVHTFAQVRAAMHSPDAEEKLSHAKSSSHLPAWWQCGKSDFLLYKGVLKHGLNNWEAIRDDHELGLAPEVGAEDFPKERVLQRRLEYTTSILCNGPPQQLLKEEGTADEVASGRALIQPSFYAFEEDDDEDRPPVRRIDASDRKKLTPVERDADGRVMLPANIGGFLVHDLGTVVYDRKEFHSDKYIYPIGYKVVKTAASMLHSGARARYICEILDGDDGPLFRITPEEDKAHPVTHASSSAAWLAVLKKVEDVKVGPKRKVVSVSGPEYFGLANKTIQALIEELPNSDRCARYVRRFTGEDAVETLASVGGSGRSKSFAAEELDEMDLDRAPPTRAAAKNAMSKRVRVDDDFADDEDFDVDSDSDARRSKKRKSISSKKTPAKKGSTPKSTSKAQTAAAAAPAPTTAPTSTGVAKPSSARKKAASKYAYDDTTPPDSPASTPPPSRRRRSVSPSRRAVAAPAPSAASSDGFDALVSKLMSVKQQHQQPRAASPAHTSASTKLKQEPPAAVKQPVITMTQKQISVKKPTVKRSGDPFQAKSAKRVKEDK
eukprot:TRINITY_DN6248_c0_g1_i1.p1 TRINITY_DN6248_c0_g1~~TRINITY_DN6248_c0_g1_i1.p1  ORF type:complete len:1850 (-),score=436.56 TRINITY_DN6248_c0_g1_i1:95-5080(-)